VAGCCGIGLALSQSASALEFPMQPPAYHRAYRYVELPAASVGWKVLVALLPAVVLLRFARQIMDAHAALVTGLLTWLGVPITTRAAALGNIPFTLPSPIHLPVPGPFYSGTVAIIAAVVAVATLLPRRRLTPVRVLTGIVALICSTSGFFFWFFPQRFPYFVADVAGAWCRAEFVVWVVIPILFAVILAPLPISAPATFLFTTETILYAVWFSAVRVTLLLLLFEVGGLIWMAPAYFVCGCLIDFFYIVAYYSLAVSRASRSLRCNRDPWRW